ncbi:MAG: glutamine synthetase type III [Betaproteobacteria bacterium]|nr:glutamine synthetase type III [Betaproteobacteria bacterium]
MAHGKTTAPVPSVRTIERPRNLDGSLSRVADFYGSNVFDLRAMAKKLSSHDLDTMSKVMKLGGKIDSTLAERVASAAREWSIEKGATHYCHWFQPQTGTTAEKHDAFLWLDKNGHPIERFTGKELLQSEPDASSFPSGGMRSTFEARGYTSWDPSSPMFVMETENGRTLYIPSVFISYHGDALDFKTPLLRSNDSLNKEALKTLHLLGEKNVTGVITTVGAEQEFFVVARDQAMARPDLRLSGRTVFGKRPAKGQELEDHYFGHIPTRVHAFINELEIELYKVGVPIKTRHNEVAPGQFEVAPIFEGSNIAADHNQLLMKVLRTVGARHNFSVLLHEKPFAGVNGSGKHVNWSMSDSTGRNLLDPGNTPHQNLVFLTFLGGVMQGIFDHADVLRASVASTGNDHRLGANEAPPAIISCFLGDTLDKILTAIEAGKADNVSAERAMLDLGVNHLQHVALDNTDRNRTSPFAFTGNKFEFRAVGSSASISFPTAILNAAVTAGLTKVNAKLGARAKNGSVSPEGVFEVLREVIRDTRNIRFEGNGYSQEWRDEAARRGLGNYPDTPAALGVWSNTAKTQFLVETGTFTSTDLESRAAIQWERYIKQRLIEVNAAIEMAQTGILPTALTHLSELVSLSESAARLHISTPAQKLAGELGQLTVRFETALSALRAANERVTSGDAFEHHELAKTAKEIAAQLLPKLEDLRSTADALEALIPASKWPFPTYQELLFPAD